MMLIKDARTIRAALVVKLSDIMTGDTITGSRDLTVRSGDGLNAPVVKPDGYFVFTAYRPESIFVRSAMYCDAEISTALHSGGVLRFALIPKIINTRTITVPKDAYIGFSGRSYALAEALSEVSTSILLEKEDFYDSTDLYHVLVTPEGGTETVYLEKNLGGSRYLLRAPPCHAYQVRGTRAVALHRTSGELLPVPQGEDTIYIMSDGMLSVRNLEE